MFLGLDINVNVFGQTMAAAEYFMAVGGRFNHSHLLVLRSPSSSLYAPSFLSCVSIPLQKFTDALLLVSFRSSSGHKRQEIRFFGQRMIIPSLFGLLSQGREPRSS